MRCARDSGAAAAPKKEEGIPWFDEPDGRGRPGIDPRDLPQSAAPDSEGRKGLREERQSPSLVRRGSLCGYEQKEGRGNSADRRVRRAGFPSALDGDEGSRSAFAAAVPSTLSEMDSAALSGISPPRNRSARTCCFCGIWGGGEGSRAGRRGIGTIPPC